MNTKPALQLKLSTGLTLTPQLQQSIRLLQLSTLELSQEIAQIVQENPLLEFDDGNVRDEFEAGNFLDSFTSMLSSDSAASPDTPAMSENTDTLIDQLDEQAYSSQEPRFDMADDEEGDSDFSQLAAKPTSLREHLLLQISLSQLSERKKKIAGLLIDSLDEEGYLTQDLDELTHMLEAELGIGIEDWQAALEYVQQLDPPGVGARDLKECLMLQLHALPENTPFRKEALELVSEHLESLAAKNFRQLKKVLDCDETCLQSIQQLITRLNPRPGACFNTSTARYITPDVIVAKLNNNWAVRLNPDSVPRIHINHLYARILKHHRDETTQPLMGQLKEARWLIRNIHQRLETILRVSQAIVNRQQAFLEHGEIAIRPLVMREIAETLGLHESTISRVTNQKFMRTPHGIFELKYFFGSHVSTESGETCSAIAIRGLIKQLIQNEDQRKPLNDGQISRILAQQGIVVARRTVAKYREFMHIPPTNLRKAL
ncbi:RNA polymerase factor sigma-54 [Nitrosomonas sp. ANs5]|uniref:RNA polymerase factor sigma-54 n=1 Tax=Nitrosomonas sp. ANs5 TaxID=3423941 RepID=UPI003D3435F7